MEHRASDAVQEQEEQETAAPAVSGEDSKKWPVEDDGDSGGHEAEVVVVEADDEGYRTPTSPRHRLRPLEVCPQAPRVLTTAPSGRKTQRGSDGLMWVSIADLLASWCHRKDSSHLLAFRDRRASDGVQEEEETSAAVEAAPADEAVVPSDSDDGSGVSAPPVEGNCGSGGHEGEADDEGYRTPTSPRHRLRPPEVCPSPPWPRRVTTSPPHGMKRSQPERAGEISVGHRRRVVAKKSLF